MFSSQRVLFLDSLFVIQSCFLSTMPPFSCGYFLRDFHDFLHSHIRSCLSQHHYHTALHQPPAEMLQPGRCHLLTCTEDSGVVTSKPWPTAAAQIVTSQLMLSGTTHCCRLADIYWLSTSYQGDSLSRHRAGSQHRHHPHHRPSMHPPGATPVRDTCLSIANNAIPFITSVGSSAPTSRSVASLQKTPSIITASSTIHAAHAFFQLRIIACSWAPFSPLLSHRPHQRPTLVFISRDSRTFPRTFIRQRY